MRHGIFFAVPCPVFQGVLCATATTRLPAVLNCYPVSSLSWRLLTGMSIHISKSTKVKRNLPLTLVVSWLGPSFSKSLTLKFSIATHTVPSLQNSMQFHITRGTQSAYMLIKNKVHAIVAYTTA